MKKGQGLYRKMQFGAFQGRYIREDDHQLGMITNITMKTILLPLNYQGIAMFMSRSRDSTLHKFIEINSVRKLLLFRKKGGGEKYNYHCFQFAGRGFVTLGDN